jgi:GTP-binding protein
MTEMKTHENPYIIFSRECKFVAGAANVGAIPNTHLAEVAFVGRSNVGKSSLLNAIVNRNSLARISQNPGCTRQINFFNLADACHLVDLPGYGFARTSKVEKERWSQLIFDYLRGRPQLKRVFLLIDGRHQIKESDIETMGFLDECAVLYQIVLTKTDKVSAAELTERHKAVTELAREHGACHPEILLTSSKSKTGLNVLRDEILALIS